MPRVTLVTVLKLLVASLVVGALMAWLQIRPGDVLHWITSSIEQITGSLYANMNAAIGYVLLGAVIVLPIWLLSLLVQFLKRR